MSHVETHRFEAEVHQVLSLVINSLYSNKDIFLRELISNASDALDKLRFEAITRPELLSSDSPLQIRLQPDPQAGTLTISDNGVGMSHDELVGNLGTIARSGSRAFLEKVRQSGGDVAIIGQFGVGFYSAYLVADRVEVVSRAADSDAAWRWASDAHDTFTVEPAERAERGTSVILHLRDDQKSYLEEWTLERLVRRYSDYVSHPVLLLKTAASAESDEEDARQSEWKRINQAAALWQRPAAEIDDAQYQEFYQHLTGDWEAPLARTHFTVEGTQQFTGLLFVPARPPLGLFDQQTRHGVRLYVKRVLIMDECEELLPPWLRFVRGVIDSADLPLNVSRELLQDSRAVQVIRKQIVKKALELLEALAQDRPEDYRRLWEAFGEVLKEGLHYEPKHRQRLAALVRFASTAEELTSLADYVARMPEGQPGIYYALGTSRKMLQNSPHLEVLKKKGFEVLLLTDTIDQWAVEGIEEFEGKPLLNAMQADLALGEPDADGEAEKDHAELGALLARTRSVLGEALSEVRVSERLTDSPVCLVTPEGGLASHIERLLRARNQDLPPTPRILEINPGHPVIAALQQMLEAPARSEEVEEWIRLLYDQALLAEGSPIEDPHRFARAMTRLMQQAAGR